MFVRPKKPTPEPHVRRTLNELGYEFDVGSGKLVNMATIAVYEYEQPGASKKQNKELYESLIHPASRHVYSIITGNDLQMQPIAVPDARQPHCNIYATPGALEKKHLVVIITGHGTFAAVWGWNVLVKSGLNVGSVIGYIRSCVQRGFGVLLLNPNENIVAPDGCSETFNSYNGQSTSINGSETPNEHVGFVWTHIIRSSAAKSVVFVSYSSSSIAIIDLLKYDYARFAKKVACVAFIDSTHSTFLLRSGAVTWLKQAARHWETSTETSDELLFDKHTGCSTVLVKNDSGIRELTPSLCMDNLLDYIADSFKRGPIADIPEMSPGELLADRAVDTGAFDSSSSDSDLEDNAVLGSVDNVQVVNTIGDVQQSSDGYIGWC
ncbi:hypothetical protein BX070DRAFT_14671 [Coemansia spiralis]|nr:hypothetical protein BX070DRAFT_14671 [Coemansia spiralis]